MMTEYQSRRFTRAFGFPVTESSVEVWVRAGRVFAFAVGGFPEGEPERFAATFTTAERVALRHAEAVKMEVQNVVLDAIYDGMPDAVRAAMTLAEATARVRERDRERAAAAAREDVAEKAAEVRADAAERAVLRSEIRGAVKDAVAEAIGHLGAVTAVGKVAGINAAEAAHAEKVRTAQLERASRDAAEATRRKADADALRQRLGR